MTPNFRKAGDEFLRLYNVAHPDKEATFIDANTTKVVALVAGGTPTDGFLTSNSTDVSGLYSKGALLPVSNYLNQNQVADIKEKMVSAAWQASYWGGKLWSTTETNDGAQLIWNKELFQNAGIPGPPKTPQGPGGGGGGAHQARSGREAHAARPLHVHGWGGRRFFCGVDRHVRRPVVRCAEEPVHHQRSAQH